MADKGKIKWGVLGCAGIAIRALIPAITSCQNAELYALASRDEDKARRIAGEHNAEKAYGSYGALLDDPEVDAVYIPLPNSMHAEWTIKAAASGKHILCEKPLAINVKECQEMIDACRGNGVKLMEAFMYLFHPQNVKVKELIEGGAIGGVKLVRASFSSKITDLNNIRLSQDLGGGAMMDLGCYTINVSRFMTASEPEEVYANVQFGQESKVDESAAGLLKFPDGVQAQFDCSFRTGRRNHYEIVGEEGTIQVPSSFVPGTIDTKIIITDMRNTNTETITIPGIDQYKLEVEHFSHCVITDSESMYGDSDALANMSVIEAVYRSGGSSKVTSV